MTSTLAQAALARALDLPGAQVDRPFDDATDVVRVGRKMFALIGREAPVRVTVKVDPIQGRLLIESEPAVVPGYYMNKRHWVTVEDDPQRPVDLELVLELVEDSHDLVAASLPAAARREIGIS